MASVNMFGIKWRALLNLARFCLDTQGLEYLLQFVSARRRFKLDAIVRPPSSQVHADVHAFMPLDSICLDRALDIPDELVLACTLQQAPSMHYPDVLRSRLHPGLCRNDIVGNWVWVSMPGLAVLLPYALTDEQAAALRTLGASAEVDGSSAPSLVVRAGDVRSLVSPGTLERLVLAGALSTPDWLLAECARWQSVIARCRADLAQEGFCQLWHLLPAHVLEAYKRHSRVCRRRYALLHQRDGHLMLWNEPMTVYLNQQLTGLASALAGVELAPTSCLMLFYPEHSMLDLHTDKEQYVYSLSLTIDYEGHVTPFVVLPNSLAGGSTRSLLLGYGEAGFFPGRTLPHFRPQLPAGCDLTSISWAWTVASASASA